MATTRRISLGRVLCPIDFSDTSHHALAHAAAIARWHDAQLTILYVFPYLPAMELPPLPLEDVDRARTLARMREFAAIVPRDVHVDCQVQEAQLVHEAIARQVEATQADMLVMGTHGRTGLSHAVMGSVAERVVQKAPCAVLTVREAATTPAQDPRATTFTAV